MLHIMSCSLSVASTNNDLLPIKTLTNNLHSKSKENINIYIQQNALKISSAKCLPFFQAGMYCCWSSVIYWKLIATLSLLMHHNVTQITWCNREKNEYVGTLEINVNFLLLFTFRHDPHVQFYEHSFVSRLAGWHWSLKSIGNTM